MDEWVGRALGPYQLQGGLGGGGMGMVYRAMHEALQQHRAIKILRPDLAADPDVVERFRREAMIAAGLRHQNIVLIYDVAEHENIHYMVMEMLEGVSLRDLIRSATPLPLERVVNLLRQLADALDYAHARGVVHRDIKPGNVMVAPNDHLTLVDFGIARAAEASRLTRSGMVIGTAEYMAPESFTGDPAGQSADLYALGIVAYELLTGHLPFTGNPTAISYAQVHNPIPSISRSRPDLPPSIEDALRRQTAKQPEDRFPSALSFVDALAVDIDIDPPTLVDSALRTPTYPPGPVRGRPRDAVTPPDAVSHNAPGTTFAEARIPGSGPGRPPSQTPPPPPGQPAAPRSAAGRLTGYVLAVLALVVAGTLYVWQTNGSFPTPPPSAATPTTVPATRVATSPPTSAPAASAPPAATSPAAGPAAGAGAAPAGSPGAAAASTAPAGAPPAATPTSAPAAAPTTAAAPTPPTAAAPPTTAPASPVAAATAPAPAPAFQDVLDERFANNQRGWPDDKNSTASLADGVYHLTAKDAGRFVSIGAPGAGALRDVEVSGRFRKTGGPPGGGFGLIVRDQGPPPRDGKNQGGRYYVFEAGEGRQYGIWRREQDHWDDLIVFTPSDAVHPPGEPNDLTVRAIGSRFLFLINGTQVADISDPALPEGGVGIYVAGDGNVVEAQQFTVRAAR